jgi:isochorismate pyruvate lyase
MTGEMTGGASGDTTPAPQNCTAMAQVRAGVDALDREIVALLARRFAYMDAAARIKPHRADVRDDVRKAEVITNAEAAARAAGIAPGLAAALWETLVEASIAHELGAWDQHRQSADTEAAGAATGDGASDGARTRDLRRDRPAL